MWGDDRVSRQGENKWDHERFIGQLFLRSYHSPSRLGNPRADLGFIFLFPPLPGDTDLSQHQGIAGLRADLNRGVFSARCSMEVSSPAVCAVLLVCASSHMLGCPAKPECPFWPHLAEDRVWFCVQNDSLWLRSELSQIKMHSLKSSLVSSVFSIGSTFASLHLFDF